MGGGGGCGRRRTVDRTNVHRIWKAILIGIALIVATACYFVPVFLIVMGLLLLLLLCARVVYRGRDRYIPNLYARDIRVYDDEYRAFIGSTLSDLRRCRSSEATRYCGKHRDWRDACQENSDELLLDLGVWIGWSNRLIQMLAGVSSTASIPFQALSKIDKWRIRLSNVEPFLHRIPSLNFMRSTGVSFHDGLPVALGRKVQFIRGSTTIRWRHSWPSGQMPKSGSSTWI